jgi:hypothetical protein
VKIFARLQLLHIETLRNWFDYRAKETASGKTCGTNSFRTNFNPNSAQVHKNILRMKTQRKVPRTDEIFSSRIIGALK